MESIKVNLNGLEEKLRMELERLKMVNRIMVKQTSIKLGYLYVPNELASENYRKVVLDVLKRHIAQEKQITRRKDIFISLVEENE